MNLTWSKIPEDTFLRDVAQLAMTHENWSSEVCDQIRLKPACSATVASKGLVISDTAATGIMLSRQGKQRCRSDCADVQSDLHLCRSHIA